MNNVFSLFILPIEFLKSIEKQEFGRISIHLLQNIYFLMKLFKKYAKMNTVSNEE